MYSDTTARPLWVLVYHLERSALDAYRIAHSAQETIGDALAIHSNGWTTQLERLQGGNASVTVSVSCKHKHSCESAWFSLQKQRNGWVVREEKHPTVK